MIDKVYVSRENWRCSECEEPAIKIDYCYRQEVQKRMGTDAPVKSDLYLTLTCSNGHKQLIITRE